MIIIDENETGLGKPRWMRKIRMRNVSLKNAVKATKFIAPIAAGFIPVGGGIASKLLSSKGGKLLSRVAKSKAVRKGISLSKTKLGRKVIGAVRNRPRPQIEPVSSLVPAGIAETNQSSSENETLSTEVEPVGELTPVKSVEAARPIGAAVQPKNNTLLYVLGAVALGGGLYYMSTQGKEK